MIIYRSFSREVILTTLAVTIVVVCLFLVLRGLIFLGQAADGLIPASGVFSLVALAMTANLDVIIPLMFYIALLMVLHRWYSDQEMIVLASCGIGVLHFLKPIAFLNIVFTIIIVSFSFYLTPLSLTKGYDLENDYRHETRVNGIITGKFVEAMQGNTVYFVEKYDDQTKLYNNVFIYQSSYKREGVVTAGTAYRTEDPNSKDKFLVLKNGVRYEGVAGTPDYRIIEFETYAVRIEVENKSSLYLPIKALPSTEIMRSEMPAKRSEWVWRIAKIFTLPVLSIFALALMNVNSRKGGTQGGVLAFIIYLSYSNILGYSVALMKQNKSLSSTPVIIVHLCFATAAIYCLYRRNFNLPLLPNFQMPLIKRISISN